MYKLQIIHNGKWTDVIHQGKPAGIEYAAIWENFGYTVRIIPANFETIYRAK